MIATISPASTKQIDFILNLLSEREMPAPSDETLADITKAEASQWIGELLDTPKPVKAVAEIVAPIVPAGRYALKVIDFEEGQNDIRFYKIDAPTEGRWAGRVFVKLLASDEQHPVRNPKAILEAIAADVEGALALYGIEIGRCGACNRTLTNKVSRDRGLGADCAQRLGF